jgi:hypothetical protein
MANTTGVFMQASEAEDLFNDYWDAFRQRQTHYLSDDDRERAIDFMRRDLSYARFQDESVKPPVDKNINALIQGVATWQASSAFVQEWRILELWVWLIVIECLRPFELWYSGRLPAKTQRKLFRFRQEAKTALPFKSLTEAEAKFKEQFGLCSDLLSEEVRGRTKEYIEKRLEHA